MRGRKECYPPNPSEKVGGIFSLMRHTLRSSQNLFNEKTTKTVADKN